MAKTAGDKRNAKAKVILRTDHTTTKDARWFLLLARSVGLIYYKIAVTTEYSYPLLSFHILKVYDEVN